MDTKSTRVSLWLTPEMCAQVDAVVRQHVEAGVLHMQRADVIRVVLKERFKEALVL